MPEAGMFAPEERVGLIEGEIIQMTPIGPPHAGTVPASWPSLFVAPAIGRGSGPRNPLHLAPADGEYQDFRHYGVGESVEPKAFPDLVIEVGTLLGA